MALTCGTRRASAEPLSGSLHPPFASLRSGGVRSGRAAACAAGVPRGTRRAWSPPWPAFARARTRGITSGARRGVPRPSAAPIGLPRAPQPPQNGGSASRCTRFAGSGPRFRSRRSLQGGRMASPLAESAGSPRGAGALGRPRPDSTAAFLSLAVVSLARSPPRPLPPPLHPAKRDSMRPEACVLALASSRVLAFPNSVLLRGMRNFGSANKRCVTDSRGG